MIYLDNAATTRKKPAKVIMTALKGLTKYNANPGRGGHTPSINAGKKVNDARTAINNYFNGYGEEYCIFTSNCTESLNLAIFGSAKKGGHVITTMLEHNSVIRPLKHLEDEGIISLTILTPTFDGTVTPSQILNAINKDTYAAVITFRSNVLGTSNNIFEIGKLCKEKNLLLICDCAQGAGHEKIDMQKLNISMLAVAGHKGTFGIGGGSALLIDSKVKLKPLKYGGTGTESEKLTQPVMLPEALESGTVPVAAIMALNAGIDFCKKNQEKITKKEVDLTKLFLNEIKKIKGIKIYGKEQKGVVAFNLGDISSTEIADILNSKYHICVRSGLHCAPLVHKFYGTTEQGAVRASFSYFTKKQDVLHLAKALKEISLNIKLMLL